MITKTNKHLHINPLKIIFFFLVTISHIVFSQETTKTDTLKDVVVSSTRIDIPFSKNSRTIQIVTSADIKNSGTTNVADLLQQVAGIDIRRRGTSGMQADLYIRGGSFDQTLLLIDGIKVEDSQTGHHTMNLALPIDVIERIEIIKGPAARIFGQNAFTGAVNIVTKNAMSNSVILETQAGSYNQKNANVVVMQNLKQSAHVVQFKRMLSDGYRFNTDYDNQNYFIKSSFKTKNAPIDVLATYNDRKFGANGFYATPAAINQYEETQASLVAVQTRIEKNNITFKPRLYWRRNQDEYIFVRNNPAIYRNLHITNKVGAELNTAITTNLGTTGFGIDVAKIAISSNNLGSRNRVMTTIFAEHRFLFLNNKFDVTPGVAANFFTDNKTNIFPGIDLGYQLTNKIRTFVNVGQTYRIPTYTDLFYKDPTTLGNENLRQEEAFSQEVGIKYMKTNFDFSLAFFNRDATNLIDFTKENASDLFKANNIRKLNTKGFELHTNYIFKALDLPQKINMGYTFIEDDIQKINAKISRYSINSARHQFTGQLVTRFIKKLSQTISFRYIERTSRESYAIFDANINYTINNLEVSLFANNIFNKRYSEENQIPMPKGNLLFGLKYIFQ
ncbi:MAG TPA: TonB-dependent receptor [Flavobacterium sp.]|nr:TonB-dependent receptor [Flavobacterium sp.]